MDYPAWMGLGGMKDTCGVSPSRERERERDNLKDFRR